MDAAQAAGKAALEDVDHMAASRDHNSVWAPWLSDQLSALGLTVYPSAANFILVRFPADKGKNSADAMNFFSGRGIIPRETGGYGLPDCLRFTIGREDEMRAVAAAASDFMTGR